MYLFSVAESCCNQSLTGIVRYILYVVAPTWQWLILAQGIASLQVASFMVSSLYCGTVDRRPEQGFCYCRVHLHDSRCYQYSVGGIVSQKYGFRAMFLVGILSRLGHSNPVMIVRKAGRKRVHQQVRIQPGLIKRSLAEIALVVSGGAVTWIFISDGVFDVAMHISSGLEPLYHRSIIGLSNVEISSYSSIVHGAMMVFLPLGGWFADKAGERAGIVTGQVFFAMGGLLFVLGSRYIHFAIVSLLYGIGGALMSPSYNSLISKVVPWNRRGVAYGLFATSLG